MSEKPAGPPSPDKVKQQMELIAKYSQIFKSPVRNILSETNEIILTTLNSMITDLVQKDEKLFLLATEVMRLKELCAKNKIDTEPKKTKEKKQPKKKSKK